MSSKLKFYLQDEEEKKNFEPVFRDLRDAGARVTVVKENRRGYMATIEGPEDLLRSFSQQYLRNRR